MTCTTGLDRWRCRDASRYHGHLSATSRGLLHCTSASSSAVQPHQRHQPEMLLTYPSVKAEWISLKQGLNIYQQNTPCSIQQRRGGNPCQHTCQYQVITCSYLAYTAFRINTLLSPTIIGGNHYSIIAHDSSISACTKLNVGLPLTTNTRTPKFDDALSIVCVNRSSMCHCLLPWK